MHFVFFTSGSTRKQSEISYLCIISFASKKNNRRATANGSGLWFACKIPVHGNPNSKKLHSKIGSFSFFILIYHHISLAFMCASSTNCLQFALHRIHRYNDEKRFSEAFVSFNNNCIFHRYYKPYLFSIWFHSFTISAFASASTNKL